MRHQNAVWSIALPGRKCGFPHSTVWRCVLYVTDITEKLPFFYSNITATTRFSIENPQPKCTADSRRDSHFLPIAIHREIYELKVSNVFFYQWFFSLRSWNVLSLLVLCVYINLQRFGRRHLNFIRKTKNLLMDSYQSNGFDGLPFVARSVNLPRRQLTETSDWRSKSKII
jgi:hypothetical protein